MISFNNFRITDDGLQWVVERRASPTRYKAVAYVHQHWSHIARALRWKNLITAEEAAKLDQLLAEHLPEVHPDTTARREHYRAALGISSKTDAAEVFGVEATPVAGSP